MARYTTAVRSIRRLLNDLDDNNLLEALDLFSDLAHFIERVVRAAVVVVTISREQNLGLHLTKAIHHSLKTKVRRARCPHSAQTGCRQHGHHRLGHVRHKPCDAISRRNAPRSQSSRYGGNLLIEVIKRSLSPRTVF